MGGSRMVLGCLSQQVGSRALWVPTPKVWMELPPEAGQV
jgi:hypothetical protein